MEGYRSNRSRVIDSDPLSGLRPCGCSHSKERANKEHKTTNKNLVQKGVPRKIAGGQEATSTNPKFRPPTPGWNDPTELLALHLWENVRSRKLPNLPPPRNRKRDAFTTRPPVVQPPEWRVKSSSPPTRVLRSASSLGVVVSTVKRLDLGLHLRSKQADSGADVEVGRATSCSPAKGSPREHHTLAMGRSKMIMFFLSTSMYRKVLVSVFVSKTTNAVLGK